jgi:hypothetical protein
MQAKLLHGEQYLEIKAPIPVQGDLVSEGRSVTILCRVRRLHADVALLCRLLEVLDKGKAASVTFVIQTKDKSSGKIIFENQGTVFIRGSGGFGGKKKGNGALHRNLHVFAV